LHICASWWLARHQMSASVRLLREVFAPDMHLTVGRAEQDVAILGMQQRMVDEDSIMSCFTP
ncbi:MAG: hypothetical protein ABR907_16770, partial [Terracidiphilus sp.]